MDQSVSPKRHCDAMDQSVLPWVVYTYIEKTLIRCTRVCLLRKTPDTVIPWTRCISFCGAYLFRKDTNTMDQSGSPNLFRKDKTLWRHSPECVSLSSACHLENTPGTVIPWTRCISFCGAYLFRKDTNTMGQSVPPNLFRKDKILWRHSPECVSLSSAYCTTGDNYHYGFGNSKNFTTQIVDMPTIILL